MSLIYQVNHYANVLKSFLALLSGLINLHVDCIYHPQSTLSQQQKLKTTFGQLLAPFTKCLYVKNKYSYTIAAVMRLAAKRFCHIWTRWGRRRNIEVVRALSSYKLQK